MTASEAWSLAEIEPFLVHEAHLLDSRRFEDWMALFTADGVYWAPAAPDQESPADHVSLIYDDKERMATRIRRLRHPRIHAQDPPSRTSRIVANAVIEETDAETCLVRSKFMIHEYRPSIPEDLERVLAGTYWHRLVRDGGVLKIAHKKALLTNCDARLAPFFVYF